MEFDLEKIKRKMLRKYPYFGSIIAGVKYEIVGNDHFIKTAATDGKTIYCNENYLSNLSEQQQVFIFSHEVCHIGLNHILRSEGKDPKLWNIATDAVINEHLKKDGLPMVEGSVDIEGAINYDAEELYEQLLEIKNKSKSEEENQNNQQQTDQTENNQNSQSQNGQEQNTQNTQQQNGQGQENQEQNIMENNNIQAGHDEHKIWEEAVKEAKKEKKHDKNDKTEEEVSEKDTFNKNNEVKVKRAEDIMKKIQSHSYGLGGTSQEVVFSDIGEASKPVTNWKRILKKYLDLDDEKWGHKFSDSSNNYTARIEDVEIDEKPETEIILDTSGSVSINLLKCFLRQVKTILKDSKIKVGTFSNEFNGFTEIKKMSDIDNLKLSVGGGTNFNQASIAFSKDKTINKICFTDGVDGGKPGIKNPRSDIIWVCYKNPGFKPDYGKVIYVSTAEIENYLNISERQM